MFMPYYIMYMIFKINKQIILSFLQGLSTPQNITLIYHVNII